MRTFNNKAIVVVNNSSVADCFDGMEGLKGVKPFLEPYPRDFQDWFEVILTSMYPNL